MAADSRGSHVIVTGGSHGIGRETVRRLVSDPNVRCSVLDLNPEPFDDEHSVRTFACDVSDQMAVSHAVERTVAWAGPPTGLVTAAGVVSNDATVSIGAELWRHIVGVHLDGTLFACQAAGRYMMSAGGGAIVTLCSVAMDYGAPGRAAYAAAKSGIRSLTRTLACEWAEYGIRANAIAPGDVRTSMYDELIAQGVMDESVVRSWHALARPGEPSEIAAAVDFLLGSDSSFITGELLKVDGGFTVKKI
ncbi:SDR family oxidoreductase [Haloechinothrix sp. YIM 98757]|uniref:SDR family oxidoreductase n=1 Tax=Haloechinothrix aidingensis TaxID=2752311 RepID=A0A838A727_9PSEU|nr:SDR family oxidoreductase [Haloechinothrix aidingensis]MBA0124257.1 SDR family oxidoreductase [Haloechinothrix aidingensis]